MTICPINLLYEYNTESMRGGHKVLSTGVSLSRRITIIHGSNPSCCSLFLCMVIGFAYVHRKERSLSGFAVVRERGLDHLHAAKHVKSSCRQTFSTHQWI
jgi:hypothetical protein